jgi:hypothetical protein
VLLISSSFPSCSTSLRGIGRSRARVARRPVGSVKISISERYKQNPYYPARLKNILLFRRTAVGGVLENTYVDILRQKLVRNPILLKNIIVDP